MGCCRNRGVVRRNGEVNETKMRASDVLESKPFMLAGVPPPPGISYSHRQTRHPHLSPTLPSAAHRLLLPLSGPPVFFRTAKTSAHWVAKRHGGATDSWFFMTPNDSSVGSLACHLATPMSRPAVEASRRGVEESDRSWSDTAGDPSISRRPDGCGSRPPRASNHGRINSCAIFPGNHLLLFASLGS